MFKEVKRVLKKEGIFWLNLGDSYNGSGGDHKAGMKNDAGFQGEYSVECGGKSRNIQTLKPKDLIGIPWRVAFALQADGWYLRQDIIWSKPNPMPESVTDRCTKSHEYIFLLAKSQKYYFDNEAIRERGGNWKSAKSSFHFDKNKDSKKAELARQGLATQGGLAHKDEDRQDRNKRSVWTITTKPFSGAHFATFPEDLITPMILAGCPKEVCNKCGKAREPILERDDKRHWTERNNYKSGDKYTFEYSKSKQKNEVGRNDAPASFKSPKQNFIGLTDCGCSAGFSSGIVLDPFMGSGTTAVVARKLGRNYLGIDLNKKYIEIAEKRLSAIPPSLF